jgi:hypothetical protein
MNKSYKFVKSRLLYDEPMMIRKASMHVRIFSSDGLLLLMLL